MRTSILSLSILCFVLVAQSRGPGQGPAGVTTDAGSADQATSIPRIVDPVHEPMLGHTAPDVEFEEEDGTVGTLSAFRGKPLLIDFWATWCGPCRKAMPEYDGLYREVKDKGITAISFDHDKEPGTALNYLVRSHFDWTNFHDPDGNVEKALGGGGIPQTILIDAQGRFLYFSLGGDTAGLRKVIAGLGPEFSSLAQ